ncbi:MFS transporter [Clostridium isatidis]|uniref:Major facilitator superfamily (MFS) profile domain-containing protein n=1 Tax=Clostridium isatidis TaxID=182773 RepID=A0A343JF70_9CLOT|nr:MFS transporter [Clostridium isatidis]ASW44178.1 hypothetical protein BEN51_12135 [Clostridium isatidis]
MKVKLYSLMVLLNSYLGGLLVPILSLLLMSKGISLSNLSIIMGIYAITVVFLELPTGVIADVMGRKKTFCLSLLISLISSLVLLFGHGFIIMCVAMILFGLSRALSSGSFDALFIDSYIEAFGKDKLNRITTRLAVLDSLGLSAGALSGGFFPEIKSNLFSNFGSYDLNIIIRIILTIIVLVLSIIFIKDISTTENEERIPIKEHIKKSSSFVKGNLTVLCIFISAFATGFFLSALETYWQPHFISIMPNKSMMGLLGIMAFLYFVAAMSGGIISNKIIDKYKLNLKSMYVVVRLLLAFILILTAFQKNIFLFIIFYTMIYLMLGMANIPEAVILNGEIPNKIRASILSVNSLVMQLGGLAGSLVSSFLISYISIPALWVVAGVVILISVLLTSKKLLVSKNDKE